MTRRLAAGHWGFTFTRLSFVSPLLSINLFLFVESHIIVYFSFIWIQPLCNYFYLPTNAHIQNGISIAVSISDLNLHIY